MRRSRVFLAVFILILFFTAPPRAQAQSQAPAPAEPKAAFDFLDRTDAVLDRIAAPVAVYRNKMRLKLDAETRYRLEYRDNFNFNDAAYEDDTLNLFRNRIGVKVESDYVTVYAQAQDAQSSAQSSLHKTSSFENQFDLRQLNVELKSPSKKIPLSAKVGRQELSYGDQRFVGAFDWSNVARVFDAAKLVFTPYSWLKIDGWFGQVVGVDSKKADTARRHENFYGLYSAIGP